jgi:hypothetical protein
VRQLIGCYDPLEAEALACYEGLSLALQWSDKHIMVDLDCSNLVDATLKETQDRSMLAHLIT